MRKVYTVLSLMLFALCVAWTVPSPAQATASTRSGFCMETYNSGNILNTCPVASTPAPVNGTSGFSAFAFTNSVGVNIHLNYDEYSNYDYIFRVLTAANIKHVRGGGDYLLSSAKPGELAEYNLMAASGIKFDMGMTDGNSPKQVSAFMNLVNPGTIEAIEAPNERDSICSINGCVQNPNWYTQDYYDLSQVLYPNRNAVSPQALVYGPTTAYADYSLLGDTSAYEDFGNTHDYMGGFNPETVGYGGVGYGGYGYGSISYNISNAKQASLTKPIVATEFGFQIGYTKQNYTPEAYQGVYLVRQLLQHMVLGIKKSYIYEMKDSGGQNFGMLRADYSQRPSYLQVAGMQNILADSQDVSNCVVPAKVNTNGVEFMGVCKSSGEYDLILWQPVLTFDPNALTANLFSPINTPIVFNAGFTPTTVSQWSFDYTSPWTNSTTVNTNSIPVTDKPTIVVINGPASPTPIPAFPTPPPTPVPTASPYIAPTPTPAPTATPTAVAIRQLTGVVNNNSNNVNVTSTFSSSPQYGDYLLAGWSFTQFGASRYIIQGPSIMQRIDPGSQEITSYSVPIACSPYGDYQQYGTVCEDLWGGYINDQAYNNTSLSWVASAGKPNTAAIYDFSGADASAPIGQIQVNLESYNTATCNGATVVRAGSVPVCIIAAKDGLVFGPGTGLSGGYTNNGWVFDGNQFADEATTYFFHYPRTTTANQVVPGFSFQDSSAYTDWTVAETVVVQPPAH